MVSPGFYQTNSTMHYAPCSNQSGTLTRAWPSNETRITWELEQLTSNYKYETGMMEAQSCSQLYIESRQVYGDGTSLEMMEVEILRDVWVHLFNACWRFGVVPSFWKRSIIVPIPKGRVKGACDTSNFRGISLTSLVGKIMCMVLNNWLADFLEAKELLADEQGGFHRGRGCRDQILSLLLIGQSMVAKSLVGW